MASGTEEKPPLYPGYYPGEPYSRRPQGSGVVKQPFGELEDPNDVLKMIDEDLENIPLHPSWWGEQIKEDIRSATVIRASPMKDKHFDAEKERSPEHNSRTR